MVFGYVRVSTKNQNTDRQVEALKKYGVDKLIIEKVSGKNLNRPDLMNMIGGLREGDTVVVLSFDRFARNTKDLLNLVDSIEKKGAYFKSLQEGLDTSGDMGRFIMTILGAVGELERKSILERQRQGIEIAKREGRFKGRRRKEIDDFEKVYQQWQDGKVSSEQAAKLLDISRSTFYRRKAEYEEDMPIDVGSPCIVISKGGK
ncbi:MAG: resolvase [Prevotellaceae bacterium]|nr:MAG: resolvase [Prevotellaceae bacterium]